MKKIVIAAMGLTALISSCKKTDLGNVEKPLSLGSTEDTLRGTITVNTTLTKKTFLLGLVYVNPGVTLTVNAGVTIQGSIGSALPDTFNFENNKGTLVIQKGAKLIANGTPNAPIVWTSRQPVGSRVFGDWGGVVLCGNAPIHRANGATSGLFEAFDFFQDQRNSYGGTNATDNSGSITYNRFEFGGGVVYQANKEVNGFTFCGVGSGTIFKFNEVLWAGDDAFEFFGGTVNIDHTLAFQPRDDNYDFDEGYVGKQQFIIAYQTANTDNSGSHLIESDNDASATNALPRTNPFIANATLIGPFTAQNFAGSGSLYYDGGIQVRRNSRLTLVTSLIIAQQHPFQIITTPTTYPLVANVPSLSDSIVIAYNIFQSNSANKNVKSAIEGNPVPLTTVTDAPLTTILNSAANGNSNLAGFSNFVLDGALKPLTGSPALTGGVDLAALGLTPFVGTTQRGAVRTTDVWTNGAWISIANN